ncbi:MAG: hypothetical protein JW892_10475 [Anaerolineae bacterium]|nr:hypothetical protein [Anaerolineae bacterium]
MAARLKSIFLLGIIILLMMVVFGCETSSTSLPSMDATLLDGTSQALALERYATQSAAEVYAIAAHQATATALAENYQIILNADQAALEQQRLAEAQQDAAAAAQAQAAMDAIVATATERAYQATATQQTRDWEATATALQTTATQQALAFAATATQLAWEYKTTATAESIQATQAVLWAEATRQARQEQKSLAVWRNYGIPIALLVSLGCSILLAANALRQFTRRTNLYQSQGLQDRPPLEIALETQEEMAVQLTPILPPMPTATGLRSVRVLRRLEQARRAGFLSDPLSDSLEAAWEQIRSMDDERENAS